MKKALPFLFLLFAFEGFTQTICNPNAKLFLFSNYDGGIVTINVNQNIPNIIIGICTYEPVQVNVTGAFVSNVSQVIYAGYNSTQNNNNCGQGNFVTSISGVPSNITQIITTPVASLNDPNGYPLIICTDGNCTTSSNTGGCNTIEQIVDYFTQLTGSQLYAHRTQYQCWQNTAYQISQGGNCCVQANVPTPPTAVISSNTTSICANQCVNFSSTNSLGGPFSSVSWSIPGGNPSTSNQANPTICFPNAGVYNVSLTVTNGNGSNTETINGYIDVSAASAPVVQFNYPPVVCENSANVIPTLASNFSNGGTFSSTAGLSINSITGEIDVSNSATGNYVVTYSAPTSNCLIPGSNIGTSNVNIESLPVVTISPAGNQVICSGESLTLTANAGFSTYNWQNVNSSNSSAVVNVAGSYSVVATSANGCSNSSNVVNVSIENTPTIQVIPADILSFCDGLSSTLTAQAGFTGYVWNNGQTGQSISVNNSGNYTVSALSSIGCTSTSNPVYVDVVNPPTALFSTSQDVSLTINFQYTGSGATTFLWNFGFNNTTSNLSNPIQEFPTNTLYNVTLTVSNECGTDTYSAQVDVLKLSIPTLESLGIKILNFDGGWIIHSGEEMNHQIQSIKLFNALGQFIFHSQKVSSNTVFIPNQLAGVYFIQIETNKGNAAGKLIGF